MKLCANSIFILENIHLVKEEAPDSWVFIQSSVQWHFKQRQKKEQF